MTLNVLRLTRDSANVVDSAAIPARHNRFGTGMGGSNGHQLKTCSKPDVQMIEILINDVAITQPAQSLVCESARVGTAIAGIVEVEDIIISSTRIDGHSTLDLVHRSKVISEYGRIGANVDRVVSPTGVDRCDRGGRGRQVSAVGQQSRNILHRWSGKCDSPRICSGPRAGHIDRESTQCLKGALH